MYLIRQLQVIYIHVLIQKIIEWHKNPSFTWHYAFIWLNALIFLHQILSKSLTIVCVRLITFSTKYILDFDDCQSGKQAIIW